MTRIEATIDRRARADARALRESSDSRRTERRTAAVRHDQVGSRNGLDPERCRGQGESWNLGAGIIEAAYGATDHRRAAVRGLRPLAVVRSGALANTVMRTVHRHAHGGGRGHRRLAPLGGSHEPGARRQDGDRYGNKNSQDRAQHIHSLPSGDAVRGCRREGQVARPGGQQRRGRTTHSDIAPPPSLIRIKEVAGAAASRVRSPRRP